MDTDLQLVKICVVSLLNFLTLGLIFPVISPHFKSIGASHAILGISGAVFGGLQVLSGPVVGSWSDLRGRKYVATVTLLISAVCYLFLGFTTSLGVVLFVRSISGLVEHTPLLTKAIIGDVLPKEKHTSAYSATGVMAALGIIIGPILSGHVVEGENGFYYVCILISTLHFIMMGFIQLIPEKKKDDKLISTSNIKTEFFKIFVELTKIDWKIFWDVLVLKFIFSFCVMVYFTNQSLYIQEKFELSQKSVGYIIALFGVLGIVSTILMPSIKAKFYALDKNSTKFLLHQYIIMTFGLLSLNLAPSLPIFVLALLPFAVSHSALTIVTNEITLNRATDKDRGSLTGVSESVMGIGRFLAPLLSGLVASYFGEAHVLIFASLISSLGIIVCLQLIFQEKTNKKE
ncbi:hypothetical protein FQA39_LY00613 [Lamprigera yunnana]|nr:hypothetical protein FQA39_LY00613 [Lamprigera yunnana]